MTRPRGWWVALALGVALGCAAQDDGAQPAPPTEPQPHERAVHVSLQLTADDVADAGRTIRHLVDTHEGYVESADARGSEGATLELRVPATSLSTLRSELAALGTITNEREDAEDVTAQHVDLSARIRSAHAEQARLSELMAVRTASLADVLSVERELARVSELIEGLEASERSLASRVAMARVSIALTRTIDVVPEPGPIAQIEAAANSGVSTAGALMVGLTRGVAFFAPIIVVFAALFVLARRVRHLFTS